MFYKITKSKSSLTLINTNSRAMLCLHGPPNISTLTCTMTSLTLLLSFSTKTLVFVQPTIRAEGLTSLILIISCTFRTFIRASKVVDGLIKQINKKLWLTFNNLLIQLKFAKVVVISDITRIILIESGKKKATRECKDKIQKIMDIHLLLGEEQIMLWLGGINENIIGSLF